LSKNSEINKIIKTWTFHFNPSLYAAGDFPQGIGCDIQDFIKDKTTPHPSEKTGSDKYMYDYEKGFRLIDIKYSTSPCNYEDIFGQTQQGVIESALVIYEANKE
jgi:hypothetical protein